MSLADRIPARTSLRNDSLCASNGVSIKHSPRVRWVSIKSVKALYQTFQAVLAVYLEVHRWGSLGNQARLNIGMVHHGRGEVEEFLMALRERSDTKYISLGSCR